MGGCNVERNTTEGFALQALAGLPAPTRAPAQRARILQLLRARGPAGATNRELNEIGFRYGARIWELRRQGFDIETIAKGQACFRFVLRAEPAESKRVPTGDWYVEKTGRPRPTGQPERLPGSSARPRQGELSLFVEADRA